MVSIWHKLGDKWTRCKERLGSRRNSTGGNHGQKTPEAWRPAPLRAPFLLSLATLLLLLLVLLEVLRQYSNHYGGIIFYKQIADLPTVVSVAYIYVPTAIALVVVTLWSFFAFDVMRLEPYFQLSRPQGASATVLFMNYSFLYGIFAPITAIRHRHWIVFYVSFMSMVVRLLLPSLCSGIIVLSEVNLTESKSLETWPTLVDLETQKAWMDMEAAYPFHHMADAENPLCRSSEYATASVSMPVDDENDTSMLRLNQTVYWANITCVSSSVRDVVTVKQRASDNQTLSWSASNVSLPRIGNENCTVDFEFEDSLPADGNEHKIHYWEPNQAASASNQSSVFHASQCEQAALYGLVIDSDAKGKHRTLPKVFACAATYQYAVANVSIAYNTSIAAVEIYQGTGGSLRHQDFDVGIFEEMTAAKLRGLELRSEASDNYEHRVYDYWKRTFVTTLNKMFNPTTSPTYIHAEQSTVVVVIQVVSDSAELVEAILGASSILLLCLAYQYPRRPNFLRSDPGSIAAQCSIVADLFSSTNVLAQLDTSFNQATSRQLRRWAKGLWCQWVQGPEGSRLEIVPTNGVSLTTDMKPTRRQRDPMPHFLIVPWFMVECIFLIAALAFFGAALQQLCLKDMNIDGSMTQIILLLLLMFIPNIIASMITVLLASALRHLALLEPWIQLQQGGATPRKSVLLSYSLRPPIAVLWKAARSRLLLLTALSFVCILDLLLSVVSGGLFEPKLSEYTVPTTGLAAVYNSSVFSRPSQDIPFGSYSLTSGNAGTNSPSRAWTVTDYSFIPLSINEPEAERTTYRAVTRGVGANVTCQALPWSQSWADSQTALASWSYQLSDDQKSNCTIEVPWKRAGSIEKYIHYFMPEGSPACQTSSFFVLARWNSSGTASMTADNTVAVHCEPTIQMNEFDVRFDHSGAITDYTPIPGSAITDRILWQNASVSFGRYNRALMQSMQSLSAHQNSSFDQFDWPGILTARAYDELSSTSASFDPDFLIRAIVPTYQMIFSTHFTVWRDLYLPMLPESERHSVNGTATSAVWGLLPSACSILIVIILVSLDILVIIWAFVSRYRRFKAPRIPRSIGSLIPWVAHSRMLADLKGTYAYTEPERGKILEDSERRYCFGNVLCADGVHRLAVDYDRVNEEGCELQDKPSPSTSGSGASTLELTEAETIQHIEPQDGRIGSINTLR
ncbi:hypothetical protein BDV25DRAFT_148831 [Aspergillus avenaceus]|uniref:Uncharacterized protein n=1 Tax=Aspergillus avenaceus TaxID=36643 RepID=A0A5N6U5W0_ASPAV|nr:hypothetical protein BDV25DRAFT_148831 [Aspergillus avenaceus]